MFGRNKSVLERLCRWYESQCDGDWEHGFGIRIHTYDNPGWGLKIALRETELEGVPFAEVKEERSEDDWIFCVVRDGHFEMAGGPLNLEEGIQRFLNWAESVGSPT